MQIKTIEIKTKKYIAVGLKEERKKAGLTMQDLATRLGVSLSCIAKLENNTRYLNQKHIEKLKTILKKKGE